MNRRTRVAAGVLIIGLLIGSFFLLVVLGLASFSLQQTYLVGPGLAESNLITTGCSAFRCPTLRDFQQPPAFAILREWPNGSWSAQAWIYNPNTLPMIVWSIGISLVPLNGTPTWWGAEGVIFTRTGRVTNVVCPFTWGYTDIWTWENGTVGVEPPTSTVSPPGFFRWLNEPGWNASFFFNYEYPVGGLYTAEYFVYVGNHTWVATPATLAARIYGMTPFQIYPQEIPPDFPYRNLVTDINTGPLPWWWGHPGLASCSGS
jgi:hypothetical protein